MESTSIVDRTLTREKWVEFCIKNFNTEYTLRQYWQGLFDQIESSEIICSNFMKFPYDVQITIVRQVRSGVPEKTISKYLELCFRAAEKHPVLKGCEGMKFARLLQIIDLNGGFPSGDFFDDMNDILNYDRHRRVQDEKSWPGMTDTAIYLLLTLYPEELMMEVIKHCASHLGGLDAYYLVLLADNWEEVKHLPFEWAVNALEIGNG